MNKIKLLTILCTTMQVMSSHSIAYNYYYNDLHDYPDNYLNNITQENLNNAIYNLFNSDDEDNQLQNNNYNISNDNNGNENSNNIQNIMNINTDYNPINIDDDDMLYNIFYISRNNNQTVFNTQSASANNIIDNNNSNNTILIGKKKKRNNTIHNNVTFTYNEFNKANDKLKSIIDNNLKTLNKAYNYYCSNGYNRKAKKIYKKILSFTRLDSKKFPILDPLLSCNDHFRINRIVQQIKELKNNIQYKINYNDNNCEEKSNEYKKLKRILNEMQNDNMYRIMYKDLKKNGINYL